MEKKPKSDGLIPDLLKIAEIDGINRLNGVEARKKALLEWLNTWILELNCEQNVINRVMALENNDFIKYHLAQKVTEQLLEECGYIDYRKNKVTLKILALKKEL